MDLNHRSPGYEPDGISRLPHLAKPTATVHRLQTTVCFRFPKKGAFLRCKPLPLTMRTTGHLTALMLALLFCMPFSGCLAGEVQDDSNPITMAVHYDSTSGTITERIQNNAILTQTGVELSFDFARVTSKAGAMKSFTLDPGDDDEGGNVVTVNANERAELSYTYLTHGLFTVTLSATDEANNNAKISLTVRIDKTIDWTQSNTDDPPTMTVSTTPDCDCPIAEKITVDSTISNPEDLVPATQVTTTWHLNDPDGDQQAFHTEQIGDGQEATWTHSQSNLASGDWTLEVTIDSGNDSISIHHIVTVLYEALESTPNPLMIEMPDEASDSLSVLQNKN